MRLVDSRSIVVRALYSRPLPEFFSAEEMFPYALVRGLLQIVLLPIAFGYAILMDLRRLAYSCGLLRTHKLDVPVISVGNITVGGTGKTPMTAWIVRWLLAQGREPAILSRGYGADGVASAKGENDEAIMLGRSLPDVPHYTDPERVRSGRKAVDRGADCLVLDDGFQHLRLHRDVNLVLVDGIEKFGDPGLPLPSGPLREMPGTLRHADAIIMTRVDSVSKAELKGLRNAVRMRARGAIICETIHRPTALTAIDGIGAVAPKDLLGRKVAVFCGIGNPVGFLRTVEGLGAEVVAAHFLPDHCAYDERVLGRIAALCEKDGAEMVVTTEKDAVKIGSVLTWPGPMPLRILRIEIAFTAGQEKLETMLEETLARWHP